MKDPNRPEKRGTFIQKIIQNGQLGIVAKKIVHNTILITHPRRIMTVVIQCLHYTVILTARLTRKLDICMKYTINVPRGTNPYS